MGIYQAKDFIETNEGLVFAVVTGEQEQQRILCSLRYQRSEKGFRKLTTAEANILLDKHYPRYLYYSAKRAVWLHAVQRDAIVHHYQPRQHLQAIGRRAPKDPLEEKLQQLLKQFAINGVDTNRMGITGSMLIGAQKSGSDIDLVFYERESFFKAREMIKLLISQQRLEPLDEPLWRDAYERRGCALSYDEYLWHEQRKYNKAAIKQTKFDISLISSDRWQDRMHYRKQGRVNITAEILDDRYGFDYPARYTLSHPSVSEAISYTATYAGQASKGERAEIQGQLEVSIAGHTRIVIGTNREASHEYIKVIPSKKKPFSPHQSASFLPDDGLSDPLDSIERST
jgi:predicted nucleotidyltransferase